MKQNKEKKEKGREENLRETNEELKLNTINRSKEKLQRAERRQIGISKKKYPQVNFIWLRPFLPPIFLV